MPDVEDVQSVIENMLENKTGRNYDDETQNTFLEHECEELVQVAWAMYANPTTNDIDKSGVLQLCQDIIHPSEWSSDIFK